MKGWKLVASLIRTNLPHRQPVVVDIEVLPETKEDADAVEPPFLPPVDELSYLGPLNQPPVG